MALPSSGQIKFSNINTELGVTSNSTRRFSDTTTRSLFGVASGQIKLSDGYGKSSVIPPLGLYIISASSGPTNPYTSADNGATWTQRTNPRTAGTVSSSIVEILNLGNGTLFALTYDYDTSYGVFDRVVSGYLTSTNGTTWTNAGTFSRTDIPSGQTRWNIYTVAAHNGTGTIVVMGTEEALGSGSTYCKVSQNYGATWTTVNFGSGTRYVPFTGNKSDTTPLKYVNNKFVCLLNNVSAGTIRFATSTDGLTWSIVTPSVGNSTSSNPLQDYAYSSSLGLYVATRQPAGDYAATKLLAYSSNLTSWTAVNGINDYDAMIAWGANKFVVGGSFYVYGVDYNSGSPYTQINGPRTVDYSTNGTSWTGSGTVLPAGSGYASQGINDSLQFAGSYFWTIGSSTVLSGNDISVTTPTFIARSSDGTTWTKLNGPYTSGLFSGKVRYV